MRYSDGKRTGHAPVSVVETEQTFGHLEPDDTRLQIGLDDELVHGGHIHLASVRH